MNYKVLMQGLHCEACKKITEKRLSKLAGVKSVNTDINQQFALIETDLPLTQSNVEDALKDTEYKVTAIVES